MKAALRVLSIIGIILLLLIAGVAGYAVYDINAGLSATDLTNITIEADDTTLYAYLAQPEGEGPFPGVLMIHEWWGIREDIVKKADKLAAEGYVVLAVDAYRGRVATGIPGALYNTITYPQVQINADMAAFYAHLASLDNVDAARVGVMGYCFGGRQTMIFATQQPGAVQVALTYYGGGQPNTVEELQPLAEGNITVLGVFGAEDGMIPLAEVDTLEASLAELGITHEITVYDGVGHAFVTELAGDSASAQAWAQGVDFLNTHLATTAESSAG
jgi:carboxymethylenebutenolidase